jgi:hypothetical protein
MENNPVIHSFIFQRKKRREKKNMTESVINIAFRIVFHSILDFFEEKIFNDNLFQNWNKKIYQAI